MPVVGGMDDWVMGHGLLQHAMTSAWSTADACCCLTAPYGGVSDDSYNVARPVPPTLAVGVGEHSGPGQHVNNASYII